MSIFSSLLKEAIENKPFDTVGDLKKAILQILNQHSKVTIGDNSPEYVKFGFKFKTYKREFRIKIFGDDSHSLLFALKKSGIHCKYSSMNDTIFIRYEDNVSKTGLLSSDAQEEIENNTYGLIGYVTTDKDNPQFFDVQERIYEELNKYNMIQWIQKNNRYYLELKEI